jgi:kynurenine formamidase
MPERLWVDLSHVVGESSPTISYLARPALRRLLSMPEDRLNLSELRMVCHSGTHVDAPLHVVADGEAIDEITFDRLSGPGVVLTVRPQPDGLIDVADLVTADVRRGDIVVIDSGWWRLIDDPLYQHHPSLTVEAAVALAARGVKLLGVDFATPDLAVHLRPEGFDFPVHRALLGAGVLVAEHLTNLDELPPGRAEFMFVPLAIAGGDGAPARVLARRSS